MKTNEFVNYLEKNKIVNKGSIIIGYPGIGKSTLANVSNGYIDLESSNFFYPSIHHMERPKGWEYVYCQLALDLCDQGYTVFTSSHSLITNLLCKLSDKILEDIKIYTCSPSINLENEWIDKLYKRYTASNSDKDLRAYERAEQYYQEDIKSLQSIKQFNHIIINDMNYNLRDVIMNGEVYVQKT